MRNRFYAVALCLLLSLGVLSPESKAQDWSRLLKGGLELVQSFTVSDDQVIQYVHQFIQESDAKNQVAPENSAYAQRLNRITENITQVGDQPLNFKVYITNDINAFACADGSVRVYSGLMDKMTDDEVLGVLGHEIGHVAHHDTRNAMKSALRTSALKDAIASSGQMAAVLTDSQLGALGEAYLNSRYSRKQESNADDYGYDFLKQNSRNPLVLALAFKKLNSLEGSSSTQNAVAKMFSTHPDTESRIKSIEKKAFKEGYSYPTTEMTQQNYENSAGTGANYGTADNVKNNSKSNISNSKNSKSAKSKSSKSKKISKKK